MDHSLHDRVQELPEDYPIIVVAEGLEPFVIIRLGKYQQQQQQQQKSLHVIATLRFRAQRVCIREG